MWERFWSEEARGHIVGIEKRKGSFEMDSCYEELKVSCFFLSTEIETAMSLIHRIKATIQSVGVLSNYRRLCKLQQKGGDSEKRKEFLMTANCDRAHCFVFPLF